ncbi:[citrate (pro-3S)-lyase] ligase [Anaeromicrobium sediminis]|uniref:[Citrate [pro-3S]-lyase] ligase n=1 Tax=Anaeromicrobium sediminis TaxID=1478221 RepID=A0A267MKE0_9FIRM|nr:[citrate (pro-3S)-lyase] ligase [Anaeromicrobium sediminis]PAB60071.1 [citrate (pro-3S)-lyase] ligase [Anaeromicrobium sediminis]
MTNYSVSEMNNNDLDHVINILKSSNLVLNDGMTYTAVLKHGDTPIGTCSFEGDVIKSFAIRPCYRASGGAAILLTHIINRMFDEGIYNMKLFSSSENRHIFESFQFNCICDTGKVILMESSFIGIESYIKSLKETLGEYKGTRSAIVMNCNPFTLGHRMLIERASRESDEVIVFVLEEDKSIFPFNVRMKLVQDGIKDLSNIKVIPSGPYMVSSATFPEYFIKDSSVRAEASAELDAHIFGSIIAKSIDITRRYVGTEPYCQTTNLYNNSLMKVLSKYDVELKVVDRRTFNEKPISATRVREYLREGNMDILKNLVPKSTFEYLVSDELDSIINKILSE